MVEKKVKEQQQLDKTKNDHQSRQMGSAKVDKCSGSFPSEEVPYHGMFDISINACLLRVHANLNREIDCPVTIKSDYPKRMFRIFAPLHWDQDVEQTLRRGPHVPLSDTMTKDNLELSALVSTRRSEVTNLNL